MRLALEFIHFTLGALVVIPLAVVPFAGVIEVRARNAPGVRGLGRASTVVGVIALVIGFLGIMLISYVPHVTIATPWLGASVILYGATLALTMGVTAPRLRAASESIARGSAASTGILTVSGVATTVFLAAMVVLMVWKP
ncbi:MAG: hypothetical protein LCH43_07610 [Actinobacteria bacterium]|nr:hypothetical protein [Actinomycetota bacterium]